MPSKNKGNLFKKEGSPYWWYEFVVAGKRTRRSTGSANERDARPIARAAKEKAQAEAKEAADREAAGVPDPKAWNIDELALKYGQATKDWLAGWENIQRDLIRLVQFFDGVIADKDGHALPSRGHAAYRPVSFLSGVRDGHIALLVALRRRDRVRPRGSEKPDEELPFVQAGTVNHTVIRLQALFTFAKDRLNLRFPFEPHWKEHLLPVAKKDARIFKGNEKERFQQATLEKRADFKPIFDFAHESSKRLDYCATLSWPQVHWDRGVIEKPGKRKPGGKEKIETVQITPEIRAILEPLIGHHPEQVFTYMAQRTRGGRVKGQRYPITDAYLATAFKRTTKQAKIEKFGFHSLRRSGATEFYDATGNDLILTQKFLGHGSPQTTARYIRRDDDDVRAGMEKRAAARSAPPAQDAKQGVPPIGPHSVPAKVA
jgi:integrase